jgi:murein DD-endopeptidase MepM/ murein hydrolase activator NlpD
MLRILTVAFAAALAANLAAAGDYQWPVCNGGEYTGFGYRVDPFTGRVAFHAGADMSGDYGDTVRAARTGKVVAAERRGPYGLMVEIDHGNTQRTRYAHLRAIDVKPGRRVAQGQKIGEVGASGRAASVHLHFEIWRNNVVVDPVRLLPRSPKCSRRSAKPQLAAPPPREPPPDEAARGSTLEELQATRFAWPVCGRKGDTFGPRKDMDGNIAFHGGLDLGLEGPGLPVRAAAAGRVVVAEETGRYGMMIEIDHDRGFKTRYGHLGSFRVKPGQLVGRGQVIGTVGATGKATGSMLHFEIWLMNVARPPLQYLEPESSCADSP